MVLDLFDSDGLAGETWLRLILRRSKQMRPHVVTVTALSWKG
jgi:hypothetical protein